MPPATPRDFKDEGYNFIEIEDGFDAAEAPADSGAGPRELEIRDVGRAAASVVLGEFTLHDYDSIMKLRNYRIPVLGHAAGHLTLFKSTPKFNTDLRQP